VPILGPKKLLKVLSTLKLMDNGPLAAAC